MAVKLAKSSAIADERYCCTAARHAPSRPGVAWRGVASRGHGTSRWDNDSAASSSPKQCKGHCPWAVLNPQQALR